MSTRRRSYMLHLKALLLGAVVCCNQGQAQPGDGFPMPAGAIQIEDVRSGKVPLGIPSSAESEILWRRNSIRSYWSRIAPRERPLNNTEVASLMDGRPIDALNRVRVPPDFWSNIQMLSNGSPTLEKSSVGMLLKGTSDANLEPWCTIILTGRDKVLTARHCVTGRSVNDSLKAYFPYEGFREIGACELNNCPFYFYCGGGNQLGCSEIVDDLAVIRLESAYEILPTATFGDSTGTVTGTNSRVVGFGTNDSNLADQGIRREADVFVVDCATCNANGAWPTQQIVERELCFKVDINSAEAIRLREFDSGGPMYHDENDAWKLSGVARGEWNCLRGGDLVESKYVNLRNEVYEDWLKGTAQDSPAVVLSTGGWMKIPHEISDRMLDAVDTHSYSISIPSLANQLIVTMNHEVGTQTEPVDIDVKLRVASGAGTGTDLSAACERHRGAEACSVEDPPSETIEITVSRNTDCSVAPAECLHLRAYQLTALIIGTNPSDGNVRPVPDEGR